MPCYHTQIGYKSLLKNPTGKRSIVYDSRKGIPGSQITMPCGNCIGCRLKKSQDWAIRCVHEASLWEKNVFITLTYDDENNPGTLKKSDFQNFIKRLRKQYAPSKIRYFAGGEYGEKTKRPHYHAILFNCDFTDKRSLPTTKNHTQYNSQILTDLWGKGHTTIGNVSQQSAQYVSKYVVKKLLGDMAKKYGNKTPEFGLMSLKPGIGHEWLKKFHHDVYKNDVVITKDIRKVRPPKYYDKKLEQISKVKYDQTMFNRKYQQYKSQKKLEEMDNKFFAKKPSWLKKPPSARISDAEQIKIAQLKMHETTL